MVVQKKTYTIAEFQQIADLPENADRILELVEGEIIEVSPSFVPSAIAALIIFHLNQYVVERNVGYVTGADGGYIMSPDDTSVKYACQNCPIEMHLFRLIWQWK
jgi:Uma2 family endonuclease